MKQNPFSLYDFMGYFIPGAVLLYGFVIIDTLNTSVTTNSFSARLTQILNCLPTLSLEGIILMLIASYAIGHILSFSSSIFVERYAVWMYGYPSRSMLGLTSMNIKERFCKHGCYGKIRMIGLTIIIFPIVVSDLFFGKLLKFDSFYARPLDKHLTELIKLKTNRLLSKLVGDHESSLPSRNCIDYKDFFRIIQHYTFEKTVNHQNKFTNYVALYGFLRTATWISVISLWYLFYHMIRNNGSTWTMWISIFVLSVVGYGFFMGYMKFYRRYTLEGLMVLAVDDGV